jgi:hypothetical protein
MFFFLTYFYSPILFHPSTYLFGNTGDSIKNYFSYEWHVQNDNSFVNYTGTNYPFGEQHAYTDGNPLLSNLIKTLPFLKDHSIAIFNLSLLFSIIVTALLLFNILKEFKVANGFSILAAIGIAMLSPQTARLPGHFTLSYSFFIPLVIYLLLLFETRDNKTKYNLFICFTVLCSFFVHPYMGMILTSMLFLYHFIKWIVYFKSIKRLVFPMIVQAVFPLLFYFIYLKVTDTHTNRTSHPYGFSFFIARFESVFVSTLPPFRHMLSQIIKIREQNWEGQAYVGISTLFAILCLPFLIFNKRKKIKLFVTENKNSAVLLMLTFSSVILLFFSMGYPFKLGGEGILDAIPFIKQFRSPGRFAWVFYFVATIGSTIILSNYFLTNANRYLKNALVSAILILFTVEAFPFHQQIRERGFVKNCFDKNNLDAEMKQICEAINKVKPEAIIPLPFFHMGTDYFGIEGTQKSKTAAFTVALNTNTPILGSCTDRTSLDEAKVSIQLFGSNLIEKDFVKYCKPGDKFCVLYSKELLQEGEQRILGKSKILLETQNYILCEISSIELLENDIEHYRKYFNENKNSMLQISGCYVKDSCFIKNVLFDKGSSQLTGKINEEIVLCRIAPGSLKTDKVYEVSFWYDLIEGDELTNGIIINEISNKKNEVITIAEAKCGQMPDIVSGKVLVKTEFKITDKENEIRINLKGNGEGKGEFSLSDLLIRQKDTDVYQMKYNQKTKKNSLSVNNFALE